MKYKIISLLMVLGVLFMAVFSLSTSIQRTATVLINTTSGATNFVEYELTNMINNENNLLEIDNITNIIISSSTLDSTANISVYGITTGNLKGKLVSTIAFTAYNQDDAVEDILLNFTNDVPLSLTSGDTLTLYYDGSTIHDSSSLIVYLPSSIANTLVLYVADDGSTYYDSALTDIAYEISDITFSGTESHIRNLVIPKKSNVTSAILIVSSIANSSSLVHKNSLTGAGDPYYLGLSNALTIQDDIVYVLSELDSALTTFNISNIDSVIHEGNISGSGSPNFLNTPKSIIVSNDIAYVVSWVDNTLTTFNVTNSSNILHLGNISGSGTPNYLGGANDIFIIGDIAYIVSENDDALTTFNISNASNMVHMGSISGAGAPNFLNGARSIYVKDDIAYVTSYSEANGVGAFTTFNVTNASNIIHLSNISGYFDLRGAQDIQVIGDIAYIVAGTADAFSTLNISNSTNIVKLDYVTSPNLNGAKALTIKNDIAYVVSLIDDALVLFDVSNVSNIQNKTSITGTGAPNYLNQPTGVAVSDDDYIFVTSWLDHALTYFTYDFASNVTIDIGNDGDAEFNHTGSLTTTNQTIDFASEVNDYLSTCTPDTNGNCEIPFNVTATNGKIEVLAINITYDYNVTHLFLRNDTYTWNQTKDVIVNQLYKRRYSIYPTSDLASNDINLTGYYFRNDTIATVCEINNIPRTITSNYCEIAENITQGDLWSLTYIYDNNITEEIAVNWSNTTSIDGTAFTHNLTIGYRDADNVSEASIGLFTNTTIEFYYNYSLVLNETLEYYNGSEFINITPTNLTNDCTSSPVYERKNISSRILHVCMDTIRRFLSLKIESNS